MVSKMDDELSSSALNGELGLKLTFCFSLEIESNLAKSESRRWTCF